LSRSGCSTARLLSSATALSLLFKVGTLLAPVFTLTVELFGIGPHPGRPHGSRPPKQQAVTKGRQRWLQILNG
jgi:hypothetical protein